MQTRWPHIYHRNTCQCCNMNAESMEHLIICPHLTNIWLSITRRTLLRLMIDIKLIDPESLFNDFLDTFDNDLSSNTRQTYDDWIHGRITHIDIIKIKNNFKSRSSFPDTYIGSRFLQHFVDGFRAEIWNPRCKVIKLWKVANNIDSTSTSHSNRRPLTTNNITTTQASPPSIQNTVTNGLELTNLALSRCMYTVEEYIEKGFMTGWSYWKGMKLSKVFAT